MSVVGLHFFIGFIWFHIGITVDLLFYDLLNLFCFVTDGGGRIRTRRAMSPCWSRHSWSIARWIWRPVSRNTSPMCGL
jgi:hypothetical protein